MAFAPDLAQNIAQGDANYLSVLDEADAYVRRNGLDLPEEPEARVLGPDPACVTDPILELDLAAAGITTIVWATGFALDYGWLQVDTFDERGRPRHQRGVAAEPGVYFLGLPWQSRRGSSFLWGVWHDADYVADQIGIQRGYDAYRPSAHAAERHDRIRRTRHDRSPLMPTHTRIRPFNTKDTYPEQNLDNDLCQAVVANGRRLPARPDRPGSRHPRVGRHRRRRGAGREGDGEHRACCSRRPASSLEDIVKVVVYLIDPRYRETVYRVMGRWLKGVFPVSTGLVVSALARPEWLVEIDATAVISTPAASAARGVRDDVLHRRARRDRRVRIGHHARRRPAVAARCVHLADGVGAVNSQNITDPRLGPGAARPAARRGVAPTEAVDAVAAETPHIGYRQLLVVDAARGRRGALRRPCARHRRARDRRRRRGGRQHARRPERIPRLMVEAFGAATGDLEARLLAAMRAAIAAGGEEGPVHSAGLSVVRDAGWRVTDLRVDWTERIRSPSSARCSTSGCRSATTTSPAGSTRPRRRRTGCPAMSDRPSRPLPDVERAATEEELTKRSEPP